MNFLIIHIVVAFLIWFGCLLVLKKRVSWRRRGFGGNFLLGWGLQVLLSMPAGIWQTIKGWPHISLSGSTPFNRLAIPFFGWPFNAGGYTVDFTFNGGTPVIKSFAAGYTPGPNVTVFDVFFDGGNYFMSAIDY